jgi:hypothetical protein
MEIVKVNEQYSINGVLENEWKIFGNISYESNHSGGNLHLNADVKILSNSEEGIDQFIGNIYYFKPVEGNVQISYSCSEELRDEMTQKVNSVIDFVLDYFKNN